MRRDEWGRRHISDIANAPKPRQTPPKPDEPDDQQSQGFFDATQEEDDLPLPALLQKMACIKPKPTYSAAAVGKRS